MLVENVMSLATSAIITSAKEILYSRPFVCPSVCEQNFAKITGRIFMKITHDIGFGPSEIALYLHTEGPLAKKKIVILATFTNRDYH